MRTLFFLVTAVLVLCAGLMLEPAISGRGSSQAAAGPRTNQASRAEGDNCFEPKEIVISAGSLPHVESGTTCGRVNDYYNTCLGAFDQGDDAIYQLYVVDPVDVSITLDPMGISGSGFAIAGMCPPGPSCLAQSTNYGGAPHTVTGLHLIPGMYTLMVDSMAPPGCLPAYTLLIEKYSSCDVTYPPGAREEGEFCGDRMNDGCDLEPPMFEPIAVGETVFGRVFSNPGMHDADWYAVWLSQPTVLTWTVRAEFNVLIGLVESNNPGSGDCADLTGFLAPSAAAGPCEEVSVTTALLPAGVHWLYVSPQGYPTIFCDSNNEYVVTLTGESEEGPRQCASCPGDTNEDGLRNGADIQFFAACFVMNQEVMSDCICSDMDGNGVLNENDVLSLVNYLLNYDTVCSGTAAYTSEGLIELEIYPNPTVAILLGPMDPDNAVLTLENPPYLTARDIGTELIELQLTGSDPTLGQVLVHERPDVASSGLVQNVVAAGDGAFLFGDSFFDVFVEIDLPAQGLTLNTGSAPVRILAPGIVETPLSNSDHDSGPVSVPVYDPTGTEVGKVRRVRVTTAPGKKCIFVVTCVAGRCGPGSGCGVALGSMCWKHECPNGTCPGGSKATCGNPNCCVEYKLVSCGPTNLPPCPPGDFCPRCEPTIFPEDPTQCPVDPTRCPPTDTICVKDPTRCPADPTFCPPEATHCPEDLTECPLVDTACPDNDPTVCEFTVCPTLATWCPAEPTVCPTMQTFCPQQPTQCPEEDTACPEQTTHCPATPTACPTAPQPTECPVSDTECPEVPTQCPPCQCAITITDCPATWLPEGRQYGTAVGLPGNSVNFTATVTAAAPRKVSFFLQNVSSEPGVCINYGNESGATPDLKFIQTGAVNPGSIFDPPSADGMTITTKDPVTSVTVTVTCYDWGAWGEIRACCHGSSGCESYADWKKIPVDDRPAGGNHIADAFRPEYADQPAGWDADDFPGNMERNGDGFTFYDEYRGTMNGTSARYTQHRRHNPGHKDLFLYDQDWLHLDGHPNHKYTLITSMLVWYLNGDPPALMNGTGFRAAGHRHVTWKAEFTHASPLNNQYALHILRQDLGGISSWGFAAGDPTDASPIGPPATAVQIRVDDAQIRTDVAGSISDQGGNPNPGGAERGAYLDVSRREITFITTHEMSHGTDVEHHSVGGGGRNSPYGDQYCGEVSCPMRYSFDLVDIDNPAHPNMLGIRTAALSPPGGPDPVRFWFSNYTDRDVSDLTPVADRFCTVNDNCRGQIDVKDDTGP